MKEFNLEEYLKNPEKKVVTRDGRKVRIICTDRKGDTPIIALIHNENGGQEFGCAFYSDGKYFIDKDDGFDLFFAPEKHEGWINIYADINDNSHPGNHIFESKEEAEEEGEKGSGYVTTIKIKWEK